MPKTLYQSPTRQATWLELFFDLVFVAVIGVITHDLGHTHHAQVSSPQLLRFPLVFIPVWWIWITHTLYANRFDSDDRPYRLITLCIMGLLVLMSTLVEASQSEKFSGYVMIYVLIRFIFAGLYLHIYRQRIAKAAFTREVAIAILLGGIISGSAVLTEGKLRFVIFYTGIIVDAALQLRLRINIQKFPVDRKHLVERTGLLAIIILGESVISIIGGLSHRVWDHYAIASAVTGFTMIWAIWWITFDSFNNLEHAKRITDGNVLIYSHLFLYMGLLILANLIGHAIKHDLDRHTFRLLAITGMGGFYFGKQITYMVCFPPFRKMIIINTFICLSITWASTYLPRIEYSLIGTAFGMLFYVYSTLKWLLVNNIDAYLSPTQHRAYDDKPKLVYN